MLTISPADLGRASASLAGALLLSTLCIVSAVGPARAVETAPAAIAA